MEFLSIERVAGLLAQAARPRPSVPEITFRDWLMQPSGSVILLLVLVLTIGGGAKGLQALRARRALARIAADTPELEAIAEMAHYARTGLVDLFRLLDHPTRPEIRAAAGQALTRLWKADQLIPEEEQAIVTRGHTVTWKARRRYPRALTRPIPMVVEFGLPFLQEDGAGVRPEHLLWSYRVAGTERASFEAFSPWMAAPARASFPLHPRDFIANGPHRLVLHLRVRTHNLTSTWERDLPQVPFTFEFDPHLALEALLTMPDESRGSIVANAVRLRSPEAGPQAPAFTPLNGRLALRDAPELSIRLPLPCDLAHAVRLEIEGHSGTFDAGEVVLSGQAAPDSFPSFPLRPSGTLPDDALAGPGETRLRAVLTVDPQLGWSDPDLRSVWPETIVTDWTPVRLVRL